MFLPSNGFKKMMSSNLMIPTPYLFGEIASFLSKRETLSLLCVRKSDEKLRRAIFAFFCNAFLEELQDPSLCDRLKWAYQLTKSSQESKEFVSPIKKALSVLLVDIKGKSVQKEKEGEGSFSRILKTAVFIRETSKKTHEVSKIIHLYGLCLALEYGPDSWFAKVKNDPKHSCKHCPHSSPIAMDWFKRNLEFFFKKMDRSSSYREREGEKIPLLIEYGSCYRCRTVDGCAMSDDIPLSHWKYFSKMKKTRKYHYPWVDIVES